MSVINFTKADLLQTTVINENKWFSFVITKVDGPKASDAGDSFNYEVFPEIIDDDKFTGKQIKTVFNSKLIGKLALLFAACLGEVGEGNFNTDDLIGKKFDGKVGTRTWEGQLLNTITEFLPYKEGSKQAPAFG